MLSLGPNSLDLLYYYYDDHPLVHFPVTSKVMAPPPSPAGPVNLTIRDMQSNFSSVQPGEWGDTDKRVKQNRIS